MFRLLRFFSITSLIAFVFVAVLLGKLYEKTAVHDVIEMGEDYNTVLTHAFANSLWERFEPFVNNVSGQNGNKLPAGPETIKLFQAVQEQMKGTAVVKVKVYNIDGLTVFSTQASQIGENKRDNKGFQTAASGIAASEMTHRKSFSAFENMVEDIDVLSSYIPIIRDGDIKGIFEIYTDITPLLHNISKSQRNLVITVTAILSILYLVLYMIVRRSDSIIRTQYNEINKARDDATLAREAADGLLLNILPEPIVERLKTGSKTIADTCHDVTVLFADIVEFTRMTGQAEPAEVVDFLNTIFSDFDEIAKRHNLEKIKTIGDAYMVAGGIPIARDDHAEAVAKMALEIMGIADSYSWQGKKIQFRIGISSGPVVAGVIGKHKFIYDIWGDTVNIASRMESSGAAGVIQVAPATYEMLKMRFRFEKQDSVLIKGKGEMETYFLLGP